MPSAIVMGDARCVWDDAAAAFDQFEFDYTICCNNIGRDWPGHVDHWCTLHPLPTENWNGMELELERRIKEGRNRPTTWAHIHEKGIDRVEPRHLSGSTGLLGVVIAHTHLSCDAVVLAGIPMTAEAGHYYDDKLWPQGPKYHHGWLKNQHEFAPFVRSMSGWTKQLFGAP